MATDLDPQTLAFLGTAIDRSVDCERNTCSRRADWVISFKETCEHAEPIPGPFHTFVCGRCLNWFRRIVNGGHVRCQACGCRVERLTHTVESIERI